MHRIVITRAGPLVTIQDPGRSGALSYGIAASGPMDRGAYQRAGERLRIAGSAAVELTGPGLSFRVEGAALDASFDGGDFVLTVNGDRQPWATSLELQEGDIVDVGPGAWGNYGYVRFAREIAVPEIIGSRATNSIVGLGGHEGRALRVGDSVALGAPGSAVPATGSPVAVGPVAPVRIVWGLHADSFPEAQRLKFLESGFVVSGRLNRMGVNLEDTQGVFAGPPNLSLVSDAIVPGDIQILGNGTPVVLMRDHQPTGGYPRLATVITADLDRFAQFRPGTTFRFQPVTLRKAQALLRRSP